jgi:hypothetical protein
MAPIPQRTPAQALIWGNGTSCELQGRSRLRGSHTVPYGNTDTIQNACTVLRIVTTYPLFLLAVAAGPSGEVSVWEPGSGAAAAEADWGCCMDAEKS